MKRWCIGALLLLCYFLELWPFPQADAGELFLVESLLAEGDGRTVTLTAEGISGSGADVAEALANLRQNAPGTLFLRQTSRVILCGEAKGVDPMALPDSLPVGAYLYQYSGAASSLDLEALAPVLAARERRMDELPTLAQARNCQLAGREFEMARLEARDGAA